MSYEWKNKVVLITGAAIGIGEKVVRFLLEDHGVKHVAALDIAEETGVALQNELNQKYGANKVKFFKCDVTNDDQLFAAFNSVKADQGNIDVVINNAGIMNDSWKVYKKEIEVNVTALVTGTLKAIELMRKDRGGNGGTVINISSVAGITKEPVMPIYWATKTAVIQFSNCIGHKDYYKKTEVRVISICYGATKTSIVTKQKLGTFESDDNSELLQALFSMLYLQQSAESAARGMIEAYKRAETGSVWIVANDKPAIDITDRFNTMYESVKEMIYL